MAARMEAPVAFAPEQKRAILRQLTYCADFEAYLGSKFPNSKVQLLLLLLSPDIRSV